MESFGEKIRHGNSEQPEFGDSPPNFVRRRVKGLHLVKSVAYSELEQTVRRARVYRGADKSLARPGRKQATVTKL